jgi:hypothetical protein
MAAKMLSLRLLRPGRRPNVMHTAIKKIAKSGEIGQRRSDGGCGAAGVRFPLDRVSR